MKQLLQTPFYNPHLSYEDNFAKGPFGDFSNKKVYENKGDPHYEVLGNPVFLPFGIGAGPLLNSRFIKAAFDKGFDIAVYKTVRSRKYTCNPLPNIVPLPVANNLTIAEMKAGVVPTNEYTYPLTITNSFGVPSFQPEFWQKDLQKALSYAKPGQLVIGSFQGTTGGDREAYIQDFVTTARMVKETGVKVLEVNLSCPNEGNAHLLCFDTPTCTAVVQAIKEAIGDTPLIVKLAYFEDKKKLEELMYHIGYFIQGVAATNTLSTKIIKQDGSQFLTGGPGRLFSGVGGKGIMWAGLEMVNALKDMREKHQFFYRIFGYGGVSSPEDYQKYLDSGADVVMSVGGAMWNPYLAQEIKKSL